MDDYFQAEDQKHSLDFRKGSDRPHGSTTQTDHKPRVSYGSYGEQNSPEFAHIQKKAETRFIPNYSPQFQKPSGPTFASLGDAPIIYADSDEGTPEVYRKYSQPEPEYELRANVGPTKTFERVPSPYSDSEEASTESASDESASEEETFNTCPMDVSKADSDHDLLDEKPLFDDGPVAKTFDGSNVTQTASITKARINNISVDLTDAKPVKQPSMEIEKPDKSYNFNDYSQESGNDSRVPGEATFGKSVIMADNRDRSENQMPSIISRLSGFPDQPAESSYRPILTSQESTESMIDGLLDDLDTGNAQTAAAGPRITSKSISTVEDKLVPESRQIQPADEYSSHEREDSFDKFTSAMTDEMDVAAVSGPSPTGVNRKMSLIDSLLLDLQPTLDNQPLEYIIPEVKSMEQKVTPQLRKKPTFEDYTQHDRESSADKLIKAMSFELEESRLPMRKETDDVVVDEPEVIKSTRRYHPTDKEDFGILPPAPLSPFDATIDHDDQNELVTSSAGKYPTDEDIMAAEEYPPVEYPPAILHPDYGDAQSICTSTASIQDVCQDYSYAFLNMDAEEDPTQHQHEAYNLQQINNSATLPAKITKARIDNKSVDLTNDTRVEQTLDFQKTVPEKYNFTDYSQENENDSRVPGEATFNNQTSEVDGRASFDAMFGRPRHGPTGGKLLTLTPSGPIEVDVTKPNLYSGEKKGQYFPVTMAGSPKVVIPKPYNKPTETMSQSPYSAQSTPEYSTYSPYSGDVSEPALEPMETHESYSKPQKPMEYTSEQPTPPQTPPSKFGKYDLTQTGRSQTPEREDFSFIPICPKSYEKPSVPMVHDYSYTPFTEDVSPEDREATGMSVSNDEQLTHEHIENFFRSSNKTYKDEPVEEQITPDQMEGFFRTVKHHQPEASSTLSGKDSLIDDVDRVLGQIDDQLESSYTMKDRSNPVQIQPQVFTNNPPDYGDVQSMGTSTHSMCDDYSYAFLNMDVDDPTEDPTEPDQHRRDTLSNITCDGWPNGSNEDVTSTTTESEDEDQYGYRSNRAGTSSGQHADDFDGESDDDADNADLSWHSNESNNNSVSINNRIPCLLHEPGLLPVSRVVLVNNKLDPLLQNDEYSQEIKNVAESAFEQINQESVTDVDFEKITQELTQKVESVEREVEELVRDIDSCEEDIILGEDESAQDDSADEEITLSENGSDLEDVSDLEADAKLKSSQAEGERKNEREEGGDDMSIPSPGELDIPLLTPVMRPDEPSPTADTPSVMSVAGDEQKFFPETNDFRNDYENEFEHFERSNNFQNDSPVGSEPGDALYDYVEEDLEPGDDVNELIEANRISVIEVAKNNMPNIPSSEDFGILPPAPLSPFDAMIDHEQNELVNSSVETVEEDDDEEEVPYKAYHADPVKSAMTEAAMPDSSLDRKSKSEEFLEEFFTKTKIEKVVDELEQNVSADNETFSVSMESVSKEASEPTRIEVDVPKSSPRIIKSTVKERSPTLL